jgi:integrase
MARPATGKVIEHEGSDGRTYRSLRFTAYGKRRFLSLGVVTAGEAERELRHALADVERGTWTPPAAIEPPPEPEQVPTFHAFAEEWWMLNHAQLAESTRADYRWRLERHLLPYFGGTRLDTITFATVERYIAAKLAEADPLSARSINMTITLLGAILERAVEQDPPLLHRNPTKGKARKAKERAPARSYLDAAGQIKALLDAAGELDHKATTARRHVERRAMIATLTFAGLRISELCALRWRDVDLAGGWLHVGEAKTDAGRRRVKVRGALRDVLLDLRGRYQDTEQNAYVFATLRGGPQSPDNFRLQGA